MRDIADICSKNARNNGKDKDVAIPSLDSLQETLNVIDSELKGGLQRATSDPLSTISNDIFDYHTLTTHTINNNLTLVEF